MNNVILSLPSCVSPEAQEAGSPSGLKTGHMNIGKDIFDTFGNDDSQNFKVSRVAQWAEVLVVSQFADECAKALGMADAQDQATGWKPQEGAKGVDKYGPVRKVLNARISEAKALFGVFKLAPDVLKEKGYWTAIATARAELDSRNVKWDGTPKPTKEQKVARKANKDMEAAMEKAKLLSPQQAGESIKDYVIRIAELADTVAENMAIDKIAASIAALHEDEDTLLSGILQFLRTKGVEKMNAVAEALFEDAAMMAGQKPAEEAPF